MRGGGGRKISLYPIELFMQMPHKPGLEPGTQCNLSSTPRALMILQAREHVKRIVGFVQKMRGEVMKDQL
jgi:hypothetical protein